MAIVADFLNQGSNKAPIKAPIHIKINYIKLLSLILLMDKIVPIYNFFKRDKKKERFCELNEITLVTIFENDTINKELFESQGVIL